MDRRVEGRAEVEGGGRIRGGDSSVGKKSVV